MVLELKWAINQMNWNKMKCLKIGSSNVHRIFAACYSWSMTIDFTSEIASYTIRNESRWNSNWAIMEWCNSSSCDWIFKQLLSKEDTKLFLIPSVKYWTLVLVLTNKSLHSCISLFIWKRYCLRVTVWYTRIHSGRVLNKWNTYCNDRHGNILYHVEVTLVRLLL